MRYIPQEQKITQNKWLILGIILLVSFIFGFITSFTETGFDLNGFIGGLSTELLGGVITFFLIDQLITKREDDSVERRRLIMQLENQDSSIVQQVIADLRGRGWLDDGALYGWFLKRANFSGIDLRHINMNGLGLYRCNLTDAEINTEQFFQLNDLRRCIMPDGSLYNGRFALHGDIEWAKYHYGIDFMTMNMEEMAKYYDVSLDEFVAGQQWAIANFAEYDEALPPYLQKLIAERVL